MLFALLTLACALAVSAIAAYYSVIGLIAIFAASPLPIALMGGSLEVAKLVTASWLYRNWKDAPRLLRYYFVSAVAVLMIITSLGIFGFLSKAHIESNLDVGDNTIKIQVLEQREKLTKERLDYLLMKAGTDPTKIAKATNEQIQATQQELIQISQEKLPLLQENNKLFAEIGPLKYLAEMIYGKEDAANHFDAAVRWVIILLIFVFDPLAVLLVIAANYSLAQYKKPPPVIKKKKVGDDLRGIFKPKKPRQVKKTKVDLTSVDPIPMNKDEIVNATELYRRDHDSM
jgi:hypothetical protein